MLISHLFTTFFLFAVGGESRGWERESETFRRPEDKGK